MRSYKLSNHIMRLGDTESENKVIFFPFAGGSASYYRPLSTVLNLNNIEVLAIQLPGRENNYSEPLIGSLTDMIELIFNEIKPYITENYCFFGHSMGGILCYEMLKKIKQENLKEPINISISSCAPPNYFNGKTSYFKCSDYDFLEFITNKGGTPKVLASNKELMKFFLPMIKKDYQAIEEYTDNNSIVIESNLTLFCGDQETELIDYMANWKSYCNVNPNLEIFEGDHFYLSVKSKELGVKLARMFK
ncbi:putative Surfactin synthase thioesterase subunit [Carnobacterium maltaromaticum]|uniref:thioesterase II family protein n=1 Tax=Carnobacterium maltaromaticum TaxID=2751 RepID=UPI00191BA02D|nr:thioesterase [Carnobacterium maltaromaticum]CAD5901763.1 putative Surfactin synthase thioesterase subunit [Carnobacterium maltaromaticum]